MEAYVMDAFSAVVFGGNQAGVVLPDRELSDEVMTKIACEFKHSETAFVKVNDDKSVTLRYFTPAGEVELCGHATIGSFALLRKIGKIGDGTHLAHTKAGELNIEVQGETVWMDMAPPQLLRELTDAELQAGFDFFFDKYNTDAAYNGVPALTEDTFYGYYVYYKNNGATVESDFNLYFPVTVEYTWGNLETLTVQVPVKTTFHSNVKGE